MRVSHVILNDVAAHDAAAQAIGVDESSSGTPSSRDESRAAWDEQATRNNVLMRPTSQATNSQLRGALQATTRNGNLALRTQDEELALRGRGLVELDRRVRQLEAEKRHFVSLLTAWFPGAPTDMEGDVDALVEEAFAAQQQLDSLQQQLDSVAQRITQRQLTNSSRSFTPSSSNEAELVVSTEQILPGGG